MKRIVFSILITFSFYYGFSQKILDTEYYFVNGMELFGIKQSNDTIYEFKCNTHFRCSKKFRKHYKILKSENVGNKTILKIERLDSIQLSMDPVPKDRFKIIGFEKLAKGKIKFINEAKKYTQESISKIPFKIKFLSEKFGFTYYSKDFLAKLKTDYTIDSDQAQAIFESLKENDSIIDLYKKTKVGDIYASGITAELIALELIERNLSPLNGVNRIEKALKK